MEIDIINQFLNRAKLELMRDDLFFYVPKTRLELARSNEHHLLRVACLPISPLGLVLFFFID